MPDDKPADPSQSGHGGSLSSSLGLRIRPPPSQPSTYPDGSTSTSARSRCRALTAPSVPPPTSGYLRRSRSKSSALTLPEEKTSRRLPECISKSAGAVASGAHCVGGSVAAGVEYAGKPLFMAKHKLEHKIDATIEDRVEWVLQMVGVRVGRMLVDPFMPERLQNSIKSVWSRFWPDIATNVRHDFMAANGLRLKSSRKITLEEWPPAPKLWPPTYSAYRARILYAVLPADVGIWQLLQMPSTYPVLLLLFFPFASVSTTTWVCLLILIDKNDEYQLANYILVFRAALFMSVGLYWSVKGFVYLYLCTSMVGGDCMKFGPGVSDTQTLKITMTMARLVCGWIAFVLLVRLRLREMAKQELSLSKYVERRKKFSFLPQSKPPTEPQSENISASGHVKTAVTRPEKWAAVGAFIGIVFGFVAGLTGTLLLFFGFSLTGHVDIENRHWTDTLLPVSLLPSVNAILGTVTGFSIAMVLEHLDARRIRREAMEQFDPEAEEPTDQQEQGMMGKIKGFGHWLDDKATSIGRDPQRALTPNLLVSKDKRRFEETLRRAFDTVDVDRSGFLSEQEVARTLSICGIKATPEEVQLVLEAYDTDKSGGLDFQEFRQLGFELRKRFRVPAVNAMTKLLLYEAISFTITVVCVILNGYINIGPQEMWEVSPNVVMYTINVLLYGPALPMVRLTLFFGLAIGCLISFLPFLVFKLPLIGPAMLKLKPTGYDKAGNVRPSLTKAQKAIKARMEKESLERDEKHKRGKTPGTESKRSPPPAAMKKREIRTSSTFLSRD